MDQLVAVFSSRLLALKGAETIFEASLQFALLWRIYISSDIGTSDCSTIPKHSTPEDNLNKGPPAPEPVIEPENTTPGSDGEDDFVKKDTNASDLVCKGDNSLMVAEGLGMKSMIIDKFTRFEN